jgi:uncharacterized damage-inducible protein DinB
MELTLPIADGYDPRTQAVVGTLAAALDDQLRDLRKQVAGLDVAQLEWQAAPGHNTIGMLLAHLALVEVFWITFAPRGMSHEEQDRTATELLRASDDGIPLPPDGAHPGYLAGFTLERYDEMLTIARARVHDTLRAWSDASLDETYELQGRKASHTVSYRWTLYHVLEHFAAHLGQIGLVKHVMRDRGVLGS